MSTSLNITNQFGIAIKEFCDANHIAVSIPYDEARRSFMDAIDRLKPLISSNDPQLRNRVVEEAGAMSERMCTGAVVTPEQASALYGLTRGTLAVAVAVLS